MKLIKTSKSDNESGQIRIVYNATGDQFTTSNIDGFFKRQMQTEQYREVYPAEAKTSNGTLVECNYIPQQQQDIDSLYDNSEAFLTQGNRIYAYEDYHL